MKTEAVGNQDDAGDIEMKAMIEEICALRERCGIGVADMYSPPRKVEEAKYMGLKPGFALFLQVPREDGDAWGFTRKEHRDEARQMAIQEEPKLLVGSPECTAWSCLQTLNKGKEELDIRRIK